MPVFERLTFYSLLIYRLTLVKTSSNAQHFRKFQKIIWNFKISGQLKLHLTFEWHVPVLAWFQRRDKVSARLKLSRPDVGTGPIFILKTIRRNIFVNIKNMFPVHVWGQVYFVTHWWFTLSTVLETDYINNQIILI